MSQATLLYVSALAAFACCVGWLLWRVRRTPSKRPVAWAPGYDLTQLGQESFQSAQRFAELTPSNVAPAGFDKTQFLAELRARYVALREALDRGDLRALSAQIAPELLERLQRAASVPARTEVVTLQVVLLSLGEDGAAQHATVEFSGLVRDHGWGGAQPLRELWLLERAASDAAWTLVDVETIG